ncbi:MAG: molecular chaperone HtpG, partial [Clostridiales bacterium]
EKEFCSISDADLQLETDGEKEDLQQKTVENKDLLSFLKDALADKVKEVRLSSRLKSHPVCLTADGEVSLEMEKVLNSMPAAEQQIKAQRVLEINSEHPIFQTINELYQNDRDKVKTYAYILYTQALLIEGLPIEDPVAYSNAVCQLLV